MKLSGEGDIIFVYINICTHPIENELFFQNEILIISRGYIFLDVHLVNIMQRQILKSFKGVLAIKKLIRLISLQLDLRQYIEYEGIFNYYMIIKNTAQLKGISCMLAYL